MKNDSLQIIKTEIVPIIQNGSAVLFLGAGYSVDTTSISNVGIPDSPELVRRILSETGNANTDPKDVDLQTAFSVGEDVMKDNFLPFLKKNFICKKPFAWQETPFLYYWRRIYTTNIDNVIDVCIDSLKNKKDSTPNFQFYNRNDQIPAIPNPLNPPIVYLHGSILKPEDGFIFDRVSYADHSIRSSDWLYDAAAHLTFGGCVIVGSKLKESDLETEIRKRTLWQECKFDRLAPCQNYVVLKSFNPIEEKSYIKRGITPIHSTAEEFFKCISENVKPLSPSKMLKRIAPHLRIESIDDLSFSWYSQSFNHITIVQNRFSNQQND